MKTVRPNKLTHVILECLPLLHGTLGIISSPGLQLNIYTIACLYTQISYWKNYGQPTLMK